MSSLGDRLIKLRKNRDLQQKEAAKQIGISSVSLSRYENGNRTPDQEMIYKLAEFYKVTPSYLLFGENKNHLLFLKDITEEEATLLEEYLIEIREQKSDF